MTVMRRFSEFMHFRCSPRLGPDGITRCLYCARPLKTAKRRDEGLALEREVMDALWLETFREAFAKSGQSFAASHEAVRACKEYRERWENIG